MLLPLLMYRVLGIRRSKSLVDFVAKTEKVDLTVIGRGAKAAPSFGGDGRLMLVSAFRRSGYFVDPVPSQTTVRSWIDRGELPGRVLGALYFVLVDWQGEPVWSTIAAEPAVNTLADSAEELTGNTLANKALSRWTASQ